MPRVVKCGLIQAAHACRTDEKIETIREANVAKHLELIEQAARQGVQILSMQEIFTGPYFCAEQSTRWYDAVEEIPDGRPRGSCRRWRASTRW
jgi:beta-ureidopropionase